MSRIAVHTLDDAPEGTRPTLETLSRRTGKIDFDDKLAALVAVVREAAGEVGDVADSTWAAALEPGWSEQQLSEAFAHLATNLFTNYVNHYARTELDVPAAVLEATVHSA